jgi:leucyl aminopeptidase
LHLLTINHQQLTINFFMAYNLEVAFSDFSLPKTGALVIPVIKNKLGAKAAEIDKKSGGAITKAIKSAGFLGKKGEMIRVLNHALPVEQVILFALESDKKNPEKSLKDIGGEIYSYVNRHRIKAASILAEGIAKPEALAFGAKLKSYSFDKYFTKKKDEEKPQLSSLTILTANAAEAKKTYKNSGYQAAIDAVFFVRDLVSEPANILYPESYASRVLELKKLGLQIEVLGVKEMARLGMGSLLGVGQGSARESKMVILRWNGGKKGAKPLAFIGKGVTFDTGGISIKPALGMEEMKFDMGGSAAVVGLLRLLAERNARVNAIGVIGLVENMPDGNAQRPGDVVTSMSGQTIEVLNTDAEGRLVLADCLWYCQSKYKPELMIDLATLTGAIIVSLGSSRAGLFANDDKLAEQLFDSGAATGEELWRMPLADVYDKQINSDIADMQNIGAEREAGSITAAQFLQRFVNGVKWAHLDIAGTAWTKKEHATCPKGATGYGVQLLDRFIRDNYE